MRRAILALLLCASVGPTFAKKRVPPPPPDPRAQEVFDRTKRTSATYAVYHWNWRRGRSGALVEHWSAEFHQGNLHRVETPDVRVVADCAAGTATLFAVNSQRVESNAYFAKGACGIDSRFPMRSLEWLERKDSRFGPLDVLRLVDPADEHIYAVDEAGVLVGVQSFARDPARRECVESEPLAVEKALPATDMFSSESLRQSFVPEKYRAAPAAAIGDLWTGTRRCA